MQSQSYIFRFLGMGIQSSQKTKLCWKHSTRSRLPSSASTILLSLLDSPPNRLPTSKSRKVSNREKVDPEVNDHALANYGSNERHGRWVVGTQRAEHASIFEQPVETKMTTRIKSRRSDSPMGRQTVTCVFFISNTQLCYFSCQFPDIKTSS
jgi:hypothetical protein